MTGCASNMPYAVTDRFTWDEAAAIIKQGFEEQPTAFRPLTVSVDSDAIRMIDERVRKGGGGIIRKNITTLQTASTLYYSDIGEMSFIHKRRYLITLRNRERTFQRFVQFESEDRAVGFLDALYRLSRPIDGQGTVR
jgi:hypothetical protein